ncbi:MAG: hypothetical protein E6K72_12245 [Candidatus Eisenbacteria bacterium]|uniref:Uncharacterized protein n=1 Tax=Eiseniibacteriota bacterium TaxID=2212470 RepID=A0A538SDS4_UNCEI|nr:MAG: hypothetical protein E6K72_12245 [Candidatus Eisenbacteria bacterium]
MSHDLRFWIETISLWKPLMSAFRFLWGVHDPLWLMLLKRLFLILPFGGVAFGYWASVLSVPSLLIRTRRRVYVGLVLITWWDLARATFTFWGGVFRFLLQLAVSLLGFAQVLVVGLWSMVREVLLMPFRLLRHFGSNALAPGTPWIAVIMTFFWCVFEAIIFTFVMTSLVIDTLSNLAGTQLTEGGVRIPLFFFMLFVVLGSYAVLATFTDALQSRDWATVIKIGVVESVALFVEVVFLYREFVDALVPWFAQHTSGKRHAHDHGHHQGPGPGRERGRRTAAAAQPVLARLRGPDQEGVRLGGRRRRAPGERVPRPADAGDRGGAQLRHPAGVEPALPRPAAQQHQGLQGRAGPGDPSGQSEPRKGDPLTCACCSSP